MRHAIPTPLRRFLVSADIQQFDAAAAERMQPPGHPEDLKQLLALLKKNRPIRMARIRADFLWMQRQLQKCGLNPEDARWML